MKIPDWSDYKDQMCRQGKLHWSVARLVELAKGLPVMDIPLDHLHTYYTYDSLTLKEMVMDAQAIEAADLDHPIILCEDGEILDGRHRLMKAIMTGAKTIKAVRFDETPSPCKVDE